MLHWLADFIRHLIHPRPRMDEQHTARATLVSTLATIAQQKTRQEELWLERELAQEEHQKQQQAAQVIEQGTGVQTLPVELPEDETALALPDTLRLEVNRLNFPIFALDDKDVRNRDSIKYTAVLQSDGEKLEINWTVAAPREYGFPAQFEKKVDLAIQEIVNGCELPITNPISFTTYHLLKRMGYKHRSKRAYDKVNQALLRILSTSITSQAAFYSKAKRERITDSFHIYERVVLRDKTLPDGRIADKNYVWLSHYFLDSINHGYTKPLSLPFYKKLRSPIAQRLYELLGVKFYGVLNSGGSYYNIAYRDLCQLLPLAPQREHKYAHRQLKQAHAELIEYGYLERVEWDGWTVRYYAGQKARTEHKQSKGAQSPFRLNKPRDEEHEARIAALVATLQEQLGTRDTRFYHYIARRVPEHIISACLKDVDLEWRAGRVKTSRGQLFTHYLKESCQRFNIPLDLKRPQGEASP